MNAEFWQSKRVLITGHTGFKGSWLSLWLQLLGAEVVGYALSPASEPSLFNVAKVADGMTSLSKNVLNQGDLLDAIAKYRPELVFHLASQALVRESYKNPVETYAINVMGVIHLLEAVRKVGGVRAVVCVTSDKCYENRKWVWGYREDEPMGGNDPYSSSKGCAELVAVAYRNSFFNKNTYSQHRVAVATARAGNVIGGGDWAKDRLVPDIIRSLMTGQDIVLRNPHATRPWQHVLDPLDGYLTLAEHLYHDGPGYSEGWNFGPAEAQPVCQVANQLLSLWGGDDVSPKYDGSYQPHEDQYLMLDSTKSRVKLGWRPALDLEASLRWIVKWVKSFQAGANMRSVTEAQIRTYMEKTQIKGILEPRREHALAGTAGSDLFDLLHETIMIRNMAGRIHYWNRGANEMYGWTNEEAVGNVSHTLLQTKFPESLEKIESELAGKGRWDGQLVHTRRNGSTIVVESRWVLDQGNPSHADQVFEINQIRR
ncbi:MAG: CDP-glucose 4,6-dehydratase [Candidatus Binatia bacterium]